MADPVRPGRAASPRARYFAAVSELDDRRARWRSLAFLYTAGGTLILVSLFVDKPPNFTVWAVAIVAILATVFGAVMWRAAPLLPDRLLVVALSFGAALITIVVYASGQGAGLYALFYVWVGIESAYFLSRNVMLGLLAGTAAVYAGVLALRPPSGAAGQWLLVMGTTVISAIVVRVLRYRVELLIERLAEAGRRDVLTGLLNRRGFHEVIETEAERARRTGRPVSLILADLDFFKALNDAHGHVAGDHALERFGRLLLNTMRRIDIAARIGGEEFVVITPDTDGNGAYVMAERIRRALREDATLEGRRLTVSIGVATFPAQAPSTEALLHAADQALYAAKSLGRDRTVVYSPEVSATPRPEAERGRTEHLSSVLLLAETLDLRDSDTANHSATVGRIARAIAERMGLAAGRIERMQVAGILHDVGKIGVPDPILRKPGPLTDAEWEEMRQHPVLGARILAGANLDDVSAWVLAHHERPDGGGYPDGLRGDEIPLEARILAVADAYEAMTSDRVYRPAIGDEAARAELVRGAGTQFDPVVVEAMLAALAAAPEDVRV
jgi:diguanylate cyclase (GGDEF)-like protein